MIIEKAVELGKALAESRELAELREAEAEFELDGLAKKLYGDYRSGVKELETRRAKAAGGAYDENDEIKYLEEKVRKLADDVERNQVIVKLMNARDAANRLTSEVNSIIDFYVNGELEKRQTGRCCERCGMCR